jgi:glycosyltransferase involved in cell wall biosynthesis
VNRSGVPAARRSGPPTAVGVVIPAQNEEQLLPACLRSVVEAARRIAIPVRIVVALDRCTDASAAVVAGFTAAGSPVRSVVAPRAGVGAARAAGMRAVLAELGTSSTWLASTDADSEVPPDWLERQVAHVRLGAEVVVGTVRVADWSAQPAAVPDRFNAAYRPHAGHRHRHGANLACGARQYLAAGGFAELARDEDVDLIERLEALGCPMVWAADLPVLTSARRLGRASGGFADHLADLAGLDDADAVG